MAFHGPVLSLVQTSVDPWRFRMLFPGTAERVQVRGGEVVAASAGEGRPVVLLHGSRDDRHFWAWNLLPLLVDDFRCVAWDQRNYGESTKGLPESYPIHAEDLYAVVRHLDLRSPLVVGASWGAKIALAYAATYPCARVFCIDDIILGNIGSVHEDIYERIPCPIFAIFGTYSEEYAQYRNDIDELVCRQRGITSVWLPSGHDITNTLPNEVARLIRKFASRIEW